MAESKSQSNDDFAYVNAGKLNNLEEWSPTSKKRKWLLISGASNPPQNIIISYRRERSSPMERSGKFLHGNSLDLNYMERAVNSNLYNSVKNLQMTKSEAIGHIRKFFEHCKANDFKPMLYYTGHGQKNTGNWCFSDLTLSLGDILKLIPVGMENPTIICDACFSGRWAIVCADLQWESLYCLSACGPDETAFDSSLFFSSLWHICSTSNQSL